MRLIRDGEKGGKGVWRWRKREIIYLSLHCHHQNDFCIKLRWAAMRAILMFHPRWGTNSQDRYTRIYSHAR